MERFFVSVLVTVALASPAYAFELKGLTLGAKTAPSQVELAMGVKCGVGANDMQVCNGQTTIGGVHGDANIVVSPRGILQRIRFSFDADSFDGLADAFSRKYGAHTTRSDIVQNAFGAKFYSVSKIWTRKNGNRLYMSKNGATLGKAFISYSTPEDRALISEASKADSDDL